MEKKALELIKNIDWAMLREQKKALVASIDYLKKNKVPITDELEGILTLIDSLQDFVVDELGFPENYVYDFEFEEERDAETKEEKFARENAEIIFQIRVESEGLYIDDEMPKKFIEGIVDDKFHADAIKNRIRLAILYGVQEYPNDFNKDENGNYTYDPTMMDYGYEIETYCQNEYYKDKKKTLWLCPHCASDNTEFKVWAKANYGNEITDDNPMEEENGWCNDCEKHGELIAHDIPYLKKVIGFQVISDDEMHPDIKNPSNIYSLSQARKMLIKDRKCHSKILTIWSGDIEEPTMMFTGDCRE